MVLPPDKLRVDIAPGGLPNFQLGWNTLWTSLSEPSDYQILWEERVRMGFGVRSEGKYASPSSLSCRVRNWDGRWVPENPSSPWFGLVDEGTPIRVIWDGERAAETDALLMGKDLTATSFDSPSVQAKADGLLLCGHIRCFQSSSWTAPGGMTAGAATTGSDISEFRTAWETVSQGMTGTREWTRGVTNEQGVTSFSVVLPGATTVVEELASAPGIGVTEIELTTDPTTQVGQWLVAIVVHGSDFDSSTEGNLEPGVPRGSFGNWRQVINSRRYNNLPISIFDGQPSTSGQPGVFMWVRKVTEAGAQTVILPSRDDINDHARVLVVDDLDMDNLVWLGSTRFIGPIAEIVPEWDNSDSNPTAMITANGQTRRLVQGGPSLSSALRRDITRIRLFSASNLAYWALEEPTGSKRARAVTIPGSVTSEAAGSLRGDKISFGVLGGDEIPDLPGSAGVMKLDVSGYWLVNVPSYTVTGNQSFGIEWFFLYPNTPNGTRHVMTIETDSPTVPTWRLEINSTDLVIRRLDRDGGTIGTVSHTMVPQFVGNWLRMSFVVHESGGNLAYRWRAFVIGNSTAIQDMSFTTGAAGTVGRVTRLSLLSSESGAVAARYYAHILVRRGVSSAPGTLRPAEVGYAGERAGVRIRRLLREESILHIPPLGDLSVTAPMGPQRPGQLINLLRECVDAEQGLLFDRDYGFGLRTVRDMCTQPVRMTLDGTEGQFINPQPSHDYPFKTNDFTASMPNGPSTRIIDQPHVDKHDRWESSAEFNVRHDMQLGNLANWMVSSGTLELLHWPRVSFQIHRDPDLLEQWLSFNPGDKIELLQDLTGLSNLEICVLGVGWDEVIDSKRYDVTVHGVPCEPHEIAVRDDDRRDTAGTERQGSSINTTTTFITFTTTKGPLWTEDDADFPFDINVGGERMTVVDIQAAIGQTQVFEVVRSVNGVVKSHPAGTVVKLWRPALRGL